MFYHSNEMAFSALGKSKRESLQIPALMHSLEFIIHSTVPVQLSHIYE